MSGWEVLPSDPASKWRRRLLIVGLLLCLPLAFYAGSYWQPSSKEAVASARSKVEDDKALQQELAELRQRVAVLTSSANVSAQANENSRLTIKLLEEKIYQQQQDIASYQGVLAPEQRLQGLQVKAFELHPTDNPQVYRYKILLSRVGKGDDPLEGQLQVSIRGEQYGKSSTLSLDAMGGSLTNALPAKPIKFSFKHFQAIPEAGLFAEMLLPKGFAPSEVILRAEVQGEKPTLHRFKWSKQE